MFDPEILDTEVQRPFEALFPPISPVDSESSKAKVRN